MAELCPICDWELIWLPAGGVMCGEHGRYDEAGDAARDLARDAAAMPTPNDSGRRRPPDTRAGRTHSQASPPGRDG